MFFMAGQAVFTTSARMTRTSRADLPTRLRSFNPSQTPSLATEVSRSPSTLLPSTLATEHLTTACTSPSCSRSSLAAPVRRPSPSTTSVTDPLTHADIGSATALTAILSASVVLYQISYGIPIALLLFRGRHKLLHPAGFPEPTMLSE